ERGQPIAIDQLLVEINVDWIRSSGLEPWCWCVHDISTKATSCMVNYRAARGEDYQTVPSRLADLVRCCKTCLIQHQSSLGNRDVAPSSLDRVDVYRNRIDSPSHESLGVLGVNGRSLAADRTGQAKPATFANDRFDRVQHGAVALIVRGAEQLTVA